MTPGELATTLLKLEPYEPDAVGLLRESRRITGQSFPDTTQINRAEVIRAVTQLNDYVKGSAAMAEKLKDLKPIALTQSDVAEIGAYCL